MATQTYQIAQLVTSEPETAGTACQVLYSVVQNAIAYKFTVTRLLLDGTGRIRVTLSAPFPDDELNSFAGAIIPVAG